MKNDASKSIPISLVISPQPHLCWPT